MKKNLMKKPSSDIVKTIDEIINGISLGKMVIFCGAGISRYSGLPISNEFIKYILKKLKIPFKDLKLIFNKRNSLKIPFESFMEVLQEESEMDELFNIFLQGEPNANHLLLAELIKSRKIKIIVTTNFDKLIEKALASGPNPLNEGKDYDILYREQDFKRINWSNNRFKLIKIHGSIDDKESMALMLNQVSQNYLSKSRMNIIKRIFSNGSHKSVLVLGYSSSDIFDITPQIQSINSSFKKVYYIQHSKNNKIESLKYQEENNPFVNFGKGVRLYYLTEKIINKIWKSLINKRVPIRKKVINTKWKKNVNDWHIQAVNDFSVAVNYSIPANIFSQISENRKAIAYYKKTFSVLNLNKTKDEYFQESCLSSIGSTFFKIGEFKKSLFYHKKALKLACKKSNKKSIAPVFVNIGQVYYEFGKYNKAETYYKEALKLVKNTKENIKVDILGNLGNVYSEKGKYKKALNHYNNALFLAKEIGEKQGEGACLNNLGKLNEDIGNYKEAIKYHIKSLKIAKDVGDRQSEGISLAHYGSIFEKLGRHKEAIKFFNIALTIAERVNDKQGIGVCYSHLGYVNQGLKKNRKALEYFRYSIDIARKLKLRQSEQICLNNIGNIFNSEGKYNLAFKFCRKALRIAQKIGDKKNEGSSLNNLGDIYYNLNKSEKALEYFKKALAIAHKIGSKEDEGTFSSNLGYVYEKLEKLKKAEKLYFHSFRIAKDMGDIQNEHNCCDYLGSVYRKLNKKTLARKYFNRSIQINISLNRDYSFFTNIAKSAIRNYSKKFKI